MFRLGNYYKAFQGCGGLPSNFYISCPNLTRDLPCNAAQLKLVALIESQNILWRSAIQALLDSRTYLGFLNLHRMCNCAIQQAQGFRPEQHIHTQPWLSTTSYSADTNTEQPTKRRFPKLLPAATEGAVELEPNVIQWAKQYEEPDPVSVQVLADSQVGYYTCDLIMGGIDSEIVLQLPSPTLLTTPLHRLNQLRSEPP